MLKILNFGSLNIDYTYKVPHFVRKGETISSKGLSLSTGGKGLNQSVALGKAGAKVYHAGCIGTDGEFLLDVMKDAGVNTDFVYVNDDVRTGNAIIQNDDDGDNCIILYGGANQSIEKGQIDKVLDNFGEGDYLVLQNEINNISYIIDKAHEKNMTIVLNPSPMDEKIEELPLEKINWFVLNEIEASQFTGVDASDKDRLVEEMHKRFPKAKFVLTFGSDGACCFEGTKTVIQKAYITKAVDTTAAGDTFEGYFLAGIVKSIPVEEALKLASKAASIAVSRPGAAFSIPRIEEVERAF